MAKSGKQRQAELAARRRAAGLVQVAVWVPAENKPTLRDVAKSMTTVRLGLAQWTALFGPTNKAAAHG